MSCDIYAICGISVRFQTLSPMPRQVAHALLTRPPLSLLRSIRRLPSINSVRLECVMHAASVHPEPGSNSRKIFYYIRPRSVTIIFELFILASFTLLSIYNSFDEICTCFLLCTYLLLFNFQWPFAAFFATALLVYHNTFALSIPFWKFFKFFQLFSFFSSVLFSRALDYSTTYLPFCQALFFIFYEFVKSVQLFCFFDVFLGHFCK